MDERMKSLVEGWSKQYGRPVSAAEVEEIKHNLSGFFNILLDWEKQFKEKGLIDEDGNVKNPSASSS